MDIGPIARTSPDATAWAQAVETPPDPGEPAAAAGTDLGSKTATLQTWARMPVPVAEASSHNDTPLPDTPSSIGDFALPESQLVATTLVGLQVEHAWTWPLPKPATNAPTQSEETHRHASDHDADQHPGEEADDDEPADAPVVERPAATIDAPNDAHCDTLIHAVHAALAAPACPAALHAAAEQWQRRRCVVIAVPQGADPAGPAWAFVLWPRKTYVCPSHGPISTPLALFGRRVDARLQWRETPVGARWSHARLMKEHHPREGRQLVALDDAGASADVQLGPVIVRRRLCPVTVRIDAVRRFWTALGAQWSVHVVVCSLPLAGRARVKEDIPC